MARISFSPLVEEIVGKLAGSVFQDSYGGFQIRTRVSPRNPQSTYQQLRRGEFGFLSASWRGLTSIERQTFIDNAASPGAALNLFLQANVNLTLIGEPTITDYVSSSDPGTMQVEFLTADLNTMEILATGAVTTVPAGTKLLVQVTFQKAPTKIFTNPSQYSPVISFDEGTDLSIPQDILPQWQSRYGQLIADKRLCLKTSLIDKSNGLRGADIINCTITEDMSKFVKIHVNVAQPATAGTATTDVDTFGITAAALAVNGDIQEYNYAGTSSSLAGTGSINFSFNGTGNILTTALGSNTWSLSVRIQRLSNTQASVDMVLKIFGVTTIQLTVVDAAVNFTTGINAKLTLQAPTSGAIIMTQCDVNKELV